jgi:hypothetical protein
MLKLQKGKITFIRYAQTPELKCLWEQEYQNDLNIIARICYLIHIDL